MYRILLIPNEMYDRHYLKTLCKLETTDGNTWFPLLNISATGRLLKHRLTHYEKYISWLQTSSKIMCCRFVKIRLYMGRVYSIMYMFNETLKIILNILHTMLIRFLEKYVHNWKDYKTFALNTHCKVNTLSMY